MSSTTPSPQPSYPIETGFLDAKSAASLDEELMATPGFTLEQLMELAGLSVAEAVYTVAQQKWPLDQRQIQPHVLLVCGPGNNGGDGLVAARHLVMFGYECTVIYPKQSSKQPHYENLVTQCRDVGVKIQGELSEEFLQSQTPLVIVDAIFGFSFHGEPRAPFDTILAQMKRAQKDNDTVIVSVDVPSGWDVDEGDVSGVGLVPDVLVSLTAPKKSARSFQGRHFVGGRFLPPALANKYGVNMPPYPGVQQVMEVATGDACNWEEEYFDYVAKKEAKEFVEYAKEHRQDGDDWQEQYAAYLIEKEAAERDEKKD
jgi:NAD(P)H-hydrate epimerase